MVKRPLHSTQPQIPNLRRKKIVAPSVPLRSLRHGWVVESSFFFFASISGGFAVFGGVGRGTGFVTGDVIEYVPKALFCFGSNGILWVYA